VGKGSDYLQLIKFWPSRAPIETASVYFARTNLDQDSAKNHEQKVGGRKQTYLLTSKVKQFYYYIMSRK